VLWVSAALAAIAFSLSNTVLGETQRTSTEVDGLRAYYVATGALERTKYELLWSLAAPNKYTVHPGVTYAAYSFPSGNAGVEIIPETAKLDINGAPPEELYRLLIALGVEPGHAGEIAAAILDWRSGSAPGVSPFDQYYLSLTPSFRARHASLEEIEELLSVKGITPELFYGTYIPASEDAEGPRLIPRPGLADCVSVFGSRFQIDANTASPAVLAAIGLSPDAINALVARRKVMPLTPGQLSAFVEAAGAGASRLRVGGNSIYTLRSTARLRLTSGTLSDLRRTVAATIKFMPDGSIHTLRWYDTAWTN
jgi:general secretion pathway protein K